MRSVRSVQSAAVLVVIAVLAAVGFVFFAKDSGKSTSASATGGGSGGGGGGGSSAAPERTGTPIGDGSTSDTGPQPNQPVPDKLKPGQKPPQFVIFSWDGAGEQDGKNLFSHFRQVAKDNNAKMTFFLSGIYALPESKKFLYHPPKHGVGASDIGWLMDKNVKLTLQQLGPAWLEGNEIGTHFNGHFCNSSTSGKTWSPDEWKSELDQAIQFVQTWRTNTGYTDIPSLPFDYKKELVGARTPCLEGQPNWIKTAAASGFRYDASSPGGDQMWPKKLDGIWNFPLQSLPMPNSNKTQLSMDYNLMYQLCGTTCTGKEPGNDQWESEAHQFYMNGFNRAYTTNRAPLFIGNHFEQWNSGIYMRAVEDTVKSVCKQADVRCVSFKQFADWIDAQDPSVVAKLQGLGVGQTPDWSTLTAGAPAGHTDAAGVPAQRTAYTAAPRDAAVTENRRI